MSKVIPTVGVIVIRNNKVLLVKHKKKAGHKTGFYGLPAGRFKKNESAVEVASRELFEETNLGTHPNDFIEYPSNEYVAEIERKNGEVVKMPYHIFICQRYIGSIKASKETKPEWIPLNKLKSLSLLPNVYKIIQDAKKHISASNPRLA